MDYNIVDCCNQCNILNNLINRYPSLEKCKSSIIDSFNLLKLTYQQKNKLLICGNGGSAADSEHIVGELMKSFLIKRKPDDIIIDQLKQQYGNEGYNLGLKLEGSLPAISLTNMLSISTAFSNDNDSNAIFAQLVYGYGNECDTLLGISTSGNSINVVNALMVAKVKGLKTIGLTGGNGGRIREYSDICIRVPENETYKIQELHVPIYHALCAMLEDYFYTV